MMRRDYVTAEEAQAMPGLRIAFNRGVPGPWSEAARAIYDIKGLDYVPVDQQLGQPNEGLRAWTGQTSAPVAVLDDERPRIHWSEILVLAEQLAPEPRLIPADEDERVTMFGLCHAIGGEDGFGWALRQILLDLASPTEETAKNRMRRKYFSRADHAHLTERARSVLVMLARRLAARERAGSGYLVGHGLSAADIYWTTFSNLMLSMSAEVCPMPDYYRQLAADAVRLLGFTAPEILIRHRDRIVADHFILPMWF